MTRRQIYWSVALFAVLLILFVTAAQAQPVIVTTRTTFACTPTAVWDGDGPICCTEGPRIRLSGIATREIDGICKPGHPGPSASGIDARNQLVSLLGGSKGSCRPAIFAWQPGRCQHRGSAGGVTTAAWCITARGVDLSCAVVASGRGPLVRTLSGAAIAAEVAAGELSPSGPCRATFVVQQIPTIQA